MDEGIAWDVSLSLHKTLTNAQYVYKCGLESLLAGSCWDNLRVHCMDKSVSKVCARCGEADDSPLHCWWTCKKNLESEDEDIIKTNKYINRAL